MPKLYKITLTAPNPPTSGYTVYYNSINPGTIAKIGTTNSPAINLTKAQLTGQGLKVTVPDNATTVILYSPECTSSTDFAIPPSVTVSLSTSAITSSTLELSWTTAPAGVVIGYLVYRNGILIATLDNVLTYTVTGLSSSTNYNFSVHAKANGNRIAGVSNSVSATTPAVSGDTTAPTIPQGLNVNLLSSTELYLNWEASVDTSGVAGYQIHRSTTSATAGFSLVGDVAVTNFYDSTVLQYNTYWYKVSAYDAASNESDFSSVVNQYTF